MKRRSILLPLMFFLIFSTILIPHVIYASEDMNEDPVYQDDYVLPEATGTRLHDADGASYIVENSDIANAEVGYEAPPKNASGKIIIPDFIEVGGVTYRVSCIEEKAFRKNKKITSVVIGKEVLRIWPKAFSGCTKLKSVTGGEKLEMIDAMAFYGCTRLKKITIPKNVWSIDYSAFGKCKKLKTITVLTKKLKKKNIGEDAFSGIHKKALFKCPKKKLSSYRKIFLARGVTKTAKFKKGK